MPQFCLFEDSTLVTGSIDPRFVKLNVHACIVEGGGDVIIPVDALSTLEEGTKPEARGVGESVLQDIGR